MPRTPTAEIARTCFLGQQKEKDYQRLARLALPRLVRQAHAGQPMTYSELAKELGMPNPRNLAFVLGSVGNTLKELEKRQGQSIPFLNLLVFSKSSHLPGKGSIGFMPGGTSTRLNETQQKQWFTRSMAEVFSYPDWFKILQQIGLPPLPQLDPRLLAAAGARGGGGESPEHRAFKYYIANTPSRLSLRAKQPPGQVEFILPSADRLDVVFTDRTQLIGVEVKSALSDEADILRGLFQCVKYKAILEAKQAVEGQVRNVRVVLVLQGKLPTSLYPTQLTLGVEVIDNVGPTPAQYYSC